MKHTLLTSDLLIRKENKADTIPTSALITDDEIKALPDIVRDVVDHAGSSTCITDIFSEMADSHTSIYYVDILHFISDHPDSLNDVVEEGLYDPSHKYDLYEHAQAAEYLYNINTLNEYTAAALLLIARYTAEQNEHMTRIPAATAEHIRGWAAQADQDTCPADVVDILNSEEETNY